MDEALSDVFDSAWRLIGRGAADRRSPLHTPVVASVGADGAPDAVAVALFVIVIWVALFTVAISVPGVIPLPVTTMPGCTHCGYSALMLVTVTIFDPDVVDAPAIVAGAVPFGSSRAAWPLAVL